MDTKTARRIGEPTRTRDQGTRVTSAKTGREILDACREIVATGSYAKISGVMVDLFTASGILAVYDALKKPENRARFLDMGTKGGPGYMADVAFKLCK